MRGLRIAVGCWALLMVSSLAAETVQVKDVRIAHAGDRTRVVLDLSADASHAIFSLSNPERLVVDVRDARFAGGAVPQGKGAVAGIRRANRSNGEARLVLDLNNAVTQKSFRLQPGSGYGHRIVVDLFPAGPQIATAQAAEPTKPPVAAKSAPTVIKTSPHKAASRDLVIAIDAGHGGKDPGARGRGGLLEKDVVLRIGERLAKLVHAEPGMRAYMTRDADRFLPLGERMQLAQRAGADLFISVHADSFTDRSVRGASVYVLSEKGATDQAARLLADRENAADQLGGVDISNADDTLAGVLVDLSQNASQAASIEVGDLLIGELQRVGKVRKPRVQKAGFKVLKSADIPSVLVETAYISNPQDESNLKSVQYQQRLAQAMHNGIRRYFYANPPEGTRIAALSRQQQQIREYVIRRGDTLSEIAQQYNVSVASLRSTNQIDGSRIRVGQVLRIPATRGI